jgi:hypothetical protein
MTAISMTSMGKNPDNGRLESGFEPLVAGNQHGNIAVITGSFGTNTNYKAFSKSIIDATSIGQTPSNKSNYVFNEPLGYLPLVYNDATRGKVLRTTQDSTHYDSVVKQHLPSNVPENTWVYWSFCQKSNLRLGGSPYPYYFQRKLGRMNYSDTIVDGQHPEVKYHVNSYAGGQYVDENRVHNAGDSSTNYGTANSVVTSDNTWHLAEIIVFTGTQGVSDGRIIVRGSRNGSNLVIKDLKNILIYSDSQRLRELMQQEYYGNFGVTADEGTRPDLIELFADSHCAIIGNKRVDLCDTSSTSTCTRRENQSWITWNGDITVKLSTAGLSAGSHNMKLRVIDGYDTNGWDVVSATQDITVEVA